MTEIKIPNAENVEISKLKVDGNNPNEMSVRHKKALAKNIQRYGFIIPVITNEDYLVADGEQRLDVANTLLHMKKVPVIKLPIKEVDRRIIRQVMNKLKGTHDRSLDLAEYERVIEDDGNDDMVELLGMTDKDMSRIYDDLRDVDEIDTPPLPVESIVKPGDVWVMSDHRLMCGDSLDPNAVNKLTNKEVADMVFTDPPYGIKYRSNNRKEKFDFIENDDKIIDFIGNLKVRKGAGIYIFTRWDVYPAWKEMVDKHFDIQTCIVWSKTGGGLGNLKGYCNQHEFIIFASSGKHELFNKRDVNVWKTPDHRSEDYEHPTQKPISLAARAIRNSSKEGDIVLDLFGGSGSTLLACEQSNRRCYIMEKDSRYCDVIIKRWEQFTGGKAAKV